MNLKDIKRVVKAMGHAILIEEDGSGLVVLPLEEYLQLAGLEVGQEVAVRVKNGVSSEGGDGWRGAPVASGNSNEQDLLLIEKLNQDIAMLKEEIKKRELEELETGLDSESVD